MNSIDAIITKVIRIERGYGNYWLIHVEIDCHGARCNHVMIRPTRQEAEQVKVGDVVKV